MVVLSSQIPKLFILHEKYTVETTLKCKQTAAAALCSILWCDVEKIRKKPKTREIRAEKQNRNNLQVIYCDLGFRSAELKKMVYEKIN